MTETRLSAIRWDLERRVGLLRQARLFDSLPEAKLRVVADNLQARRVERGGIIFRAGRPAEMIGVLAAGRIKVVRETEDGREVILRMILPGEIFGAAGAWGESVYPASAIALEDSVVLRLTTAEFSALMAQHAPLALAVVRELGGRLREAEGRIRELQTERVERRIARVLLRLANKTGVKTSEGIEIGVPLSRQDLADLVGSTLSTVSRTLSGWDQQGLIVAARERVVLVKPHLLVAIADELS
jgi:CRP/FNR family transcriptional regulator, nitrogen oxide reductase regulator